MLTTTDTEGFAALVRPGDIVAFDSLASLSGLVQWADRVPVNHCALVISPESVVMANEPKRHDPDRSAVRRHQLSEVLGLTRVRAATILRPTLQSGQLEALLAAADHFVERGCDFAVIDLAWLLPPALVRAYGEPDEGEEYQLGVRMVIDTLDAMAQQQLAMLPDTAETLTCSEFVYRCFDRAGLELHIVDPLDGRPRERGVQPETVTPGDFWRSPSLDAVAYVVKEPPRPTRRPSDAPHPRIAHVG